MSARRPVSLSVLALLFVLALAVRALPWPTVLVGDSTYFFGNDAYYHMRRILWALEHFPRALAFDPYLNHPTGAVAIWPPLFDWGVALLIRPFWWMGGTAGAERAAVWIPPLLGATGVVVLTRAMCSVWGREVAVASGVVLALLSGHYWYSQIGFVDHHAAVSLGALILLAVTLRWVAMPEEEGPGWTTVLGYALANALLLLLWPGAVVYVAVGIATLGLHALVGTSGERSSRSLERQAAAHALACLLVLPQGSNAPAEPWGPYSPTVLSHFQVWFFALCGLHAAALSAWVAGASRSERPVLRCAVALGLGGALVAVSLAFLPELRGAVGEAWQWLGRRESFQASVSESQPLFVLLDDWTTVIAERRLSRFVFVFPIALVLMARAPGARDAGMQNARWAFVAWCTVLGVLTLAQKRFFDTSSAAVATTMGWAIVAAWRWLESLSPSPARRRVGLAVGAALAAFAWSPVVESYGFVLSNQWQWMRGERLSVPQRLVRSRALVKGARWLAEHTPATRGFREADQSAEWGVLSDWAHGHVLLYEGERAPVVGNFGDDIGGANYRRMAAYFRSPEPRAVEIARSLRVRYVVSEPARNEREVPLKADTVRALFEASPLRQLARHRLVYEAPLAPSEREAGLPPPLRIFEIVPGATLVGNAEPGTLVEARLPLATPAGGTKRVEASAIASEDGRFELEIAQPSQSPGEDGAVAARSAWRVRVGHQEPLEVEVPISAIREGARLPVSQPPSG